MTNPEQARYEALAQAAAAALEAFGQAAERLAAVETRGRTRDRRVTVRVTAAGHVTHVRLDEDAMFRYGLAKLGTVVAQTLRATQQRARAEYERELAALTPPEVAECDRVLQEALRKGGAA